MMFELFHLPGRCGSVLQDEEGVGYSMRGGHVSEWSEVLRGLHVQWAHDHPHAAQSIHR